MQTKLFRRLTLFPGLLALWPAAAPAQTFTNLHNFSTNTVASGFSSAGPDGSHPAAGLLLQGGTLYGTTQYGGPAGHGTVFTVNTSGTSYGIYLNFGTQNDPYGGGPFSPPFSDFYGAYPAGAVSPGGFGTTKNSTVFDLQLNGKNVDATLYAFTNAAYGAQPLGKLVVDDNGLVYGTANQGGSGFGTVFRIAWSINAAPVGQPETLSSSCTVLHFFSDGSDGANPAAGLVLSGGMLYGTASGDPYGNGATVFKVSTNGQNFAAIYNFTNGVDGGFPLCDLVLSGNTLYGTANMGGNAGNGTVFKVNTDSSGFAVLHSFSALGGSPGTNSDGANPAAGLVLSGNTLFGTAANGGTGGNGTIFKVKTDGTGFATLYNFSPGTVNNDGANPVSQLVFTNQVLYGTAQNGGENAVGTVFALGVPAPPLNIRRAGDSVVLSWTNAGYSLQAASIVDTNNSDFTNITGATSPYTNPITGSQMFFRLN